ncbi:MAG: hypothetical protein DRN47_03850, partial [Candidatus Wolframiiraptor sp.]
VKSSIETHGSFRLILGSGKSIELTEDEMTFEEKLPENLSGLQGKFADIYIDLSETRDIIAQSLAREIIRRIQVMRKEMDLMVSDYVKATIILGDEEDQKLLNEVKNFIMEEVRAKDLEITVEEPERGAEGYTRDWVIEGKKIRMIVSKVS